MAVLVSIFTPTFNREHTLDRLFQSLQQQTHRNFEWVVIDDGSTDQTSSKVKGMQEQADFPVRYTVQMNGGKQRAINHGVRLAQGELFFVVDSDDDLTPDAVSQIHARWQDVGANPDCAGLCFRRLDRKTATVMGDALPHTVMDSNAVEMVARYNIRRDMAEIFRTSILRHLPFPEIAGEVFVPEAFIWDQASERKFLRYIDKGIYNCEYLHDGYSANFCQNFRRNPAGFLLYYQSVFRDRRRPLGIRLRALIRSLQCLFRLK